MYQLIFYVPTNSCEKVKRAVFEAGAGRIGNYDSCSWETEGSGQFRPLSGSKPYLGRVGRVERVSETKVEMVCEDEVLADALRALKEAHPYEEPAFTYYVVNPTLH